MNDEGWGSAVLNLGVFLAVAAMVLIVLLVLGLDGVH